jgi:sugar lactone lactonase YvrE
MKETVTMPVSNARRLTVCLAVAASLAQAASGADILINDAKSGPESLTVAPGGVLIVGSASTPFVYRVRAGATTAEKFIDASAEGPGTFFLGMLADASTNTLWTCQLTPVQGNPAQRHSALRSFTLDTGAPKIRWDLPGDVSVCNDFAIGPDKALYVTDTGNAKIFKLPAGKSAADLFLEDRAALAGIDGITFLNGTLYVNNVRTNKVYRVPVDGAGKAAPAVEIVLDQPVKGPDGMRAANGKLLLAENGAGKISAITVTGDKGVVTVLKEGLTTPTAVEPAGDTIWIAERGTGKAVSIPMPK